MALGFTGKLLSGVALLFSANAAFAQNDKGTFDQKWNVAPTTPRLERMANRHLPQDHSTNEQYGMVIHYDRPNGKYTMDLNAVNMQQYGQDNLLLSFESRRGEGALPQQNNNEVVFEEFEAEGNNSDLFHVKMRIKPYHGQTSQKSAFVINSDPADIVIEGTFPVGFYDKGGQRITDVVSQAQSFKRESAGGMKINFICDPKLFTSSDNGIFPGNLGLPGGRLLQQPMQQQQDNRSPRHRF